MFRRNVSTLSDVILLTNTDEGNRGTSCVQGRAAVPQRLVRERLVRLRPLGVGQRRHVEPGGQQLGVPLRPRRPNNPPLATSNYEVQHSINLNGSYRFDLKEVGVTASMFYHGQNGRPWSSIFNLDVNGDTQARRTISSTSRRAPTKSCSRTARIRTCSTTSTASGSTDYIGQIVPRNATNSPWFHSTDFRLLFDVPLGGRRKVELSFDVFNFWNLFDNNTGTLRYLTNQQRLPVSIRASTRRPAR